VWCKSTRVNSSKASCGWGLRSVAKRLEKEKGLPSLLSPASPSAPGSKPVLYRCSADTEVQEPVSLASRSFWMLPHKGEPLTTDGLPWSPVVWSWAPAVSLPTSLLLGVLPQCTRFLPVVAPRMPASVVT
jgi:hypothetical protein